MLPRELLKRIRKIEIVTERLVRDRMAGQYHSVFKGRGIAFEEVRPYIPGDDIRFIDWNVTARMNEAYVKLFSEEREMTVLLVVDMSASGRFGSRRREKRDLAAEIAAVLAFSAIRNNDRVGPDHLHRRGRELRAAQEGQAARAARRQRDPLVQEKSRRTALASGSIFWDTSCAGGGRVPDLGLSRARRQLRARAAHHRAPPRSDPGDGERSAGGGAARRRARSSSTIPRRAASSCSTRAARRRRRSRGRRARAARRARAVQAARMDPIEVRTDRPTWRR